VIRINIAFFLAAKFPVLYHALRPGGFIYNIPGMALVLGASFIQGPLAKFASWDNTQVSALLYAQTWFGMSLSSVGLLSLECKAILLGATWATLLPNAVIAAFFGVFFFRLLWPLIVQALGFLFSVFLILLPLVLFLLTGIYTIASFDSVLPLQPEVNASSSSPPSSAKLETLPFIGKKKKRDDMIIELESLTHGEEGAFFFADDLGPVAKMASGWGDSSMTVVI